MVVVSESAYIDDDPSADKAWNFLFRTHSYPIAHFDNYIDVFAERVRPESRSQPDQKRSYRMEPPKGTGALRDKLQDSPADLDHQSNDPSVKRALQWALSQEGKRLQPDGETPWYFWCARFVANCYGAEHAGVDTAYDIYQQMAEGGVLSKGDNIPEGALVFWDWRGTQHDQRYGHVGIYLGNGSVIHTGVDESSRNDGVRRDSIPDITEALGTDSYLGWAAPFSWRGITAIDWPGR
jgi:cell wall-associated NlpC family hydrolase